MQPHGQWLRTEAIRPARVPMRDVRVARVNVALSSVPESPLIASKMASSTAGMSRIIDAVANRSSQKKKLPTYAREPNEYMMIAKAKATMHATESHPMASSAEGGKVAYRRSSAKSTQSVMIAKNSATYTLPAMWRQKRRREEVLRPAVCFCSRISNMDLVSLLLWTSANTMLNC